jgi:hypothetical protein
MCRQNLDCLSLHRQWSLILGSNLVLKNPFSKFSLILHLCFFCLFLSSLIPHLLFQFYFLNLNYERPNSYSISFQLLKHYLQHAQLLTLLLLPLKVQESVPMVPEHIEPLLHLVENLKCIAKFLFRTFCLCYFLNLDF